MYIYTTGLEVPTLQIVLRAIQALRAPEVASGRRPQLCKGRRKTVLNPGPRVSAHVWTEGASPLLPIFPPPFLLPRKRALSWWLPLSSGTSFPSFFQGPCAIDLAPVPSAFTFPLHWLPSKKHLNGPCLFHLRKTPLQNEHSLIQLSPQEPFIFFSLFSTVKLFSVFVYTTYHYLFPIHSSR